MPSSSHAGTDAAPKSHRWPGLARLVKVESDGQQLAGSLVLPRSRRGIVVFAHGSGSDYHSPRNREVAGRLAEAGFGTLLFNLGSAAETEAERADAPFDLMRLRDRMIGAIRWLERIEPDARTWALGLFGASTGAAVALAAAAQLGSAVRAVVGRGGRVDLATAVLPHVTAPTLLLVGEHDGPVLAVNRAATGRLGGPHELAVVPGAGHLFEEPGALDLVAAQATAWFVRHLRTR